MTVIRNLLVFVSIGFSLTLEVKAQPVLSTGGREMPREWIDSSTHHKIIRLTELGSNNTSFYFHNRPFIGNSMVFYNSEISPEANPVGKQETSNLNPRNKQLFVLDLQKKVSKQITHHPTAMNGEIVFEKGKRVYFQSNDSVFSVNSETKETKLIFVFPADFKGTITCVNANGKLLGGAKASEEEKEILKKNPGKSSYFNLIYDAHLPRTLFTIDIEFGRLDKIFTDSAWLNHVQFSPTDPQLMMYCHEGPWHKVNRIWTINISTKKITQIHQRVMDMEIAGHEWFSRDGKIIWYDLQQPRGEDFFVEGHEIKTGKKIKYHLERNEWSIHFNTNTDNSLFAGDGGDPGQVAKAPDGQWIYLFKPVDGKFISEKLVNMKNHKYNLEPNVHFSPDGKWVIFRANFEGTTQVYAVELKKSIIALQK